MHGSIFIGYLTKDLFRVRYKIRNNAIFIALKNLTMIDAEFIPIYVKWLPVIESSGATLSMVAFLKDFLFTNAHNLLVEMLYF